MEHLLAMKTQHCEYWKVEYHRLSRENAELLKALKEISEGSGRFSKDPLRHAENCIEDMKKIAIAALTREPAAL